MQAENKGDMPNWNRFVNEILSSRSKEQKKEAKGTEDKAKGNAK